MTKELIVNAIGVQRRLRCTLDDLLEMARTRQLSCPSIKYHESRVWREDDVAHLLRCRRRGQK